MKLTPHQRSIYESYRTTDLVLEREIRRFDAAEMEDKASAMRSIQVKIADACERDLLEAGMDAEEVRDGFRNWIAFAFAEHAEFVIALEESAAQASIAATNEDNKELLADWAERRAQETEQ